jgi:hypothetical protein
LAWVKRNILVFHVFQLMYIEDKLKIEINTLISIPVR